MIINERLDNTPEKKKILCRVITQKTRPDTDTLNPSGNPDNFNNLYSVLKKMPPENKVEYLTLKKTETVKVKINLKENLKKEKNDENMQIDAKTIAPKNKLNANIDLNFLPKRVDRYGNGITKNGKQRVTFTDRITKNNIAFIIKVESFKPYNKMEEVSYGNKHNNCCNLV